MKTIVMLLLISTMVFAQQQAETKSWMIDPAYVEKCVYGVNVGRSPYEALLRSLVSLIEKISSSQAEIYPESMAADKFVATHNFGNAKISYLKKSFAESSKKKGDTLQTKTTVSFYIKLHYEVKTKKCFVNVGSDYTDLANDETFNSSSYDSRTTGERSLSYGFRNMTFADLLAELEQEGVHVEFKTEYDVTYALATYPLSKLNR